MPRTKIVFFAKLHVLVKTEQVRGPRRKLNEAQCLNFSRSDQEDFNPLHTLAMRVKSSGTMSTDVRASNRTPEHHHGTKLDRRCFRN